MKKLLSILTITSLLATMPIVMADDNITVTIDGNPIEFDVPPMIINDRTMVPMRAIFEELGATVDWNDETKTAFGEMSGIGVSFTLDDIIMIKNTVPTELDTPATIVNDRVLLPIRAVAESFGMNVLWNNSSRTVIIDSSNNLKTLYYDDSNMVWYKGEVEVNGNYPSGYGTTWNKDGSIEYTGQFEYGLFNGQGCLYNNSKAAYIGMFSAGKPTGDGKYINSININTESPQAVNQNNYEKEKTELHTEYLNKLTEIYKLQQELDDLINTDPYSTEEAKSILGKYDMSTSSNIKGANGSNVDSYSAANAMRQQAALYSKAQEMVLNAYNSKIETMRKVINDTKETADNWYFATLAALKIKYNIDE